MIEVYPKEDFPDHIKHMLNTRANQLFLEYYYGSIISPYRDGYYIEVNLQEKNWKITFDFAWLYRNPPPLVTTEELKQLIS